MKAKQRDRKRPIQKPGTANPNAVRPNRPRGFPRGFILLVAVVAVALACWFGAKWWQNSPTPLAQQSPPAPMASPDRSATPAGTRHGSRVLNNDQAFIAKVNNGNKLLAEGKPEEALQVLNEALQMNPEDEDVHYNLGLAYTRLGKYEEAVKQYEEALRIFPDYVEAHNNLGNLFMRLGKTEPAIAQFELAVKIMPDYASAHNNLGSALGKAGRTNDALAHFQQAARINPDYWEAHFNVGTSCLRQGRLDEARTEFETVLRLRPDFSPAKAALAQITAQQMGASPQEP
jgi:Tfp pilus assembly protein PilF